MSEESAWAKVDELTEKLERVKGIVDRVAADPSNATDELWVYSIRKALDGDQPFVISPRKLQVARGDKAFCFHCDEPMPCAAYLSRHDEGPEHQEICLIAGCRFTRPERMAR